MNFAGHISDAGSMENPVPHKACCHTVAACEKSRSSRSGIFSCFLQVLFLTFDKYGQFLHFPSAYRSHSPFYLCFLICYTLDNFPQK